ncbi:sugar-binding transcriptional regulator [Tabrizicola sp.]|uniref:sugar-binding transcriptional regulator n=1 Tax=Tabrizicola sp. TaxID=2005166 RepID=UPI002733D121|nr:sugar-binding domain-containing protein [Tabrizicola sp.]MDP3194626.1 sugar-binding domain-containing protein [Tabrizicola sp.]
MARAPKLPQIDTEERFLAQVAWAYHVEGLTQEKVAEKLGATRLRVNKALSEATARGLVRITFNTAFAACAELEAALRARFGLRQAYVAPAPMDARDVQMIVGAALGNLLSEVLVDPRVRLFGMSWGGTLNIATRFVAAMERPDLEVISVMGGLTRGSDLNSFEITTRLADLLGAQHSYFTAPLYAGSRESRDTIMQLDVFREVLEKLRGVDALAMAAGDISKNSLLMRDGLPGDVTMEDLRALGAVGDVLGVVIDAEGHPIAHPINERVIGIGLDDLGPIPNVILAAGGPHKVAVVRAVLKRGVVNTLVTDEATSRALLGSG